MSTLNDTPSGERIHIGLFGCRNAGKSSLINALTGQNLAVVSEIAGTTTDPVSKAMELLPLGPVVLIDTAGLDDEGPLGSLRVQKSWQALNKTDIALIVADNTRGLTGQEYALIERIREKKLPCVLAFTKADLPEAHPLPEENPLPFPSIRVSAATGYHIRELKELLAHMIPERKPPFPLCSDLLRPGDNVILVTPADSAAPKGRLILPQQQVIREILDAGACALVTQEDGVPRTLQSLREPPSMVITDSQAFQKVNHDTPPEIPLTSFSILMARHKGNLEQAVLGVAALKTLRDGDPVLISEGCTHHRQCGDIGTVKLPRWLREFTGKNLTLAWSSGTEFPTDLSPYRMVIHCGGCMLNEREMQYRYRCAAHQRVPMTNYGLCIAYVHGILKRSLSVFPELAEKI